MADRQLSSRSSLLIQPNLLTSDSAVLLVFGMIVLFFTPDILVLGSQEL